MTNSKGSIIVKNAISRLMDGQNLTREESRSVMNEIMQQKATDAQISAYLVAMRMKGETVDEIHGSVEAVSSDDKYFTLEDDNAVDTCGTGGADLSTFNISTAAAFVTAGAGVKVAKHGYHSVSGRCGSADLLKKLGVHIQLNRKQMIQCFHDIGITFVFSAYLRKNRQYALGPRQEIGARNLFNLLGPITNPAHIKRQVIGVYNKNLMQPLINVLKELGSEHVMMVHGADGLDEITLNGKTYILELKGDQIKQYS
ncbi:MAG: anthranilate phosphoribosyltransferase, partial [Caldithrix sp.]|nr:anthranilate phosphoribosyltransferase [Caldithrix sp.]